ncbi:MAG: response regulator [Saprospiraceae bacterium]
MDFPELRLLLADDDNDDCIFFKEALDDLPYQTLLNTVVGGVELLHYLSKNRDSLPDALFLDLNMPRKTGFECLNEIRQCEYLKDLPVIILSTSYDQEVINLLFERGAQYYMRKPGDFHKLKLLIHKAIVMICEQKVLKPSKSCFVLQLR